MSAIWATRRSWRPPSNGVVEPELEDLVGEARAPRCGRPSTARWRRCARGDRRAVYRSLQSAARTPCTLLAAICSPWPVPPSTMPRSASPATTARADGGADGRVVDRLLAVRCRGRRRRGRAPSRRRRGAASARSRRGRRRWRPGALLRIRRCGDCRQPPGPAYRCVRAVRTWSRPPHARHRRCRSAQPAHRQGRPGARAGRPDRRGGSRRRRRQRRAASILSAIDSVRIVSLLSWRYRDPGALVAERLGAAVAPHRRHAAGRQQSAVAGEPHGARHRRRPSRRRAHRRRRGVAHADVVPGRPAIDRLDGAGRFGARGRGHRRRLRHDASRASWRAALRMPVQVYPMFEQALRIAAGRSIDEHLVRISELWSRFSEVAAANPNAWIQRRTRRRRSAPPAPTTDGSASRTRS